MMRRRWQILLLIDGLDPIEFQEEVREFEIGRDLLLLRPVLLYLLSFCVLHSL